MIFSSVFCVNVSATETFVDEAKINKLKRNLDYLIIVNQEHLYIVGECFPVLDWHLTEVCDEVSKVLFDKTATYEELLTAYDKLLYADYNLMVQVELAEGTYELALKEQNYNNWYSEEDWSTFVKNRDALKEALDTGLNSKITEAFYDLLYCYNVMTNRYTLKGDVNRDGEVNVIDATLVQKYLAGLEDFTGAQRMLCGDYDYECFDISAATTIQKYSAGLIKEIPNRKIFISDSNPYESYERRMERTLNFIICPRTTDGFYMIDNGYYDTQFLDDYFTIYYEEL